MTRFKSSLLAAVVSAAATAGCLYAVHRARAHEAAQLRRQNDHMRAEAYEKIRDRQTPPAIEAAASSIESKAIEAGPESLPAAPRASAPIYRNAGWAAPREALQTFAWACDCGDVAMVQKMMYWEGTSREKIAAHFASFADVAQRDASSVDSMAAAELVHSVMASPFPAMDVLDAEAMETPAGDRALFRLPGTRWDRTQFQKTEDGWKFVVTDELVDRYLAALRASAGR